MPAISKIRFTNVIYENGAKRYNDETFQFDGYNAALVLENGGGKTVFIQAAIQAILPHQDVAERKIRESLSLEGSPCHIAIEWILNEKPRLYLVTAVTLFISSGKLDSYRYVYQYGENDEDSIEKIPFTQTTSQGDIVTDKGRINEYYSDMKSKNMNARTFDTIKNYHKYIEDNYKIIPSEWRSIVRINNDEGGVEGYFDNCKTTVQLVDRLLIPVIEDTMPGDSLKSFSDTFEEQRKRFKNHKQLRGIIEESKELQIQINRYMSIFEKYNNSDQDFIEKQQYAKSIYLYADKEKKDIDERILRLEEDIEVVSSLKYKLETKVKSYEIAILEDERSSCKRNFREIEKIYDEINDEYNNICKRLHSLNISQIKKRIQEERDIIMSLEKDIEMLEDKDEVKDINDIFKINTSKIYGHFLKIKSQLKTEKLSLKEEHFEIKGDYEKEQKHFKQLLERQTDLYKDINIKKGKADGIEGQMEDVLKDIVVINKNETIVEQQKLWAKKASDIDRLMSENESKSRNFEIEKGNINNELFDDRKKLKDLEQEITLKKNEIEKIDRDNEKLSITLKEHNDRFKYTESIYDKEQSITSYMERQLINLNIEKEELLSEERKSGRFKDDYINMKHFTVEPLINEYMDSWKNQFNYIETGTQYIQRAANALDLSKQDILKNYPYWSMSIIVEDKELEKLKDIIYKNINKISLPILILGQDEASSIIKEERQIEDSFILPTHWEQNIDQGFFEKWKLEVENKVNEITKERIKKEDEISQFSKLKNDLQAFFHEYSYEYYRKLREHYNSLELEDSKLNKFITNKEERIIFIDKEVKRMNEQNVDSNEEYISLNQWIKLSHQYIKLERNKDGINKEIDILKQDDIELKIEINSKQRDLDIKERNIKQLEEKLGSCDNNLRNLENKELYKEVAGVKSKDTDESLHLLTEERNRLKDIINKNSKDLGSLNKSIKDKKERIIELERDLDRKKKDSKHIIDEKLEFPPYGDEEIDRLLNDKIKLEPEIQEVQKELDYKKHIYTKSELELDLKKQEYYKDYEEIIKFSDLLHEVKDSIENEEKDIQIRENKNKDIKKSLDKEKIDINAAIQELNMINVKYKYKAEDIQIIHLEESFYTGFPYNRLNFIEELSVELSKLEDKKKQLEIDLNDGKQQCKNFCNNGMKDVRLREICINGINHKDNYEEALKWQEEMNSTIDNLIKILENDIRGHDKDLEKFISNLVVHLRKITDELKEIPKKTRIKIGDNNKEIFQFTIPEWKEENAKDDIRKYVDKMVEELDKEKFKNEDNTENKVSVRKEVEKWLDSKQLLAIALRDDAIKIKCRKVSNDAKAISGLNSWESSNRWSGGEKWSKNTTLFLGILNYIAERRGGIIPGVKTSRTVIMDNPFGKASSDHVLDPVFLIAEKLGFQIIALTAHAEGSFIRNYFPIVYSCRLRESINGETLIIDAEKQVKHSFFKDKDPQILNRIEEREQVSLFE